MTPDAGAPDLLAGCAQALARAARETSYVALDRRALEDWVRRWVAGVAGAVLAEPFSTAPGYPAGAELVGVHFTGPEIIGQIVKVLSRQLLPALDRDTESYRGRLAGVLGGVATGYARALRDRALDDQEDIRRAAYVAQRQAEQALRSSEEQRRRDARRDPLTDLPNRLHFTEQVAAAVATGPGERVGICLLGLDGFQVVNDTFGPDTGDRLLRAVAERLSGVLDGQLIARLGGDEFGLLVTGTGGPDDVVKLADRLLGALGQAPLVVGPAPLTVTASVGLVERPAAGTDPDDLLRAADIALWWAKKDGRDRWRLFNPARSAEDTDRWELAAELPAAIEGGQLVVHYQPMVRADDGRVRAVEALVRWQHPRLGLLQPSSFVDSAEDTGLVVPMGRYVLREACREAAGWGALRADPPLLSVNLAARQARDPGVVADVLGILAATGLPPERLQLEVLERTVLHPEDDSVQVLRALAAAGIRIAVDDFGTGHANHTYLRRLPLQELKLAAEFVRRVGGPDGDPVDQHIAASMIDLGHTVGLGVTAEGVETAAQAAWLRRAGCDTLQGWFYCRAVPADELHAVLRG